LVGPGGKVVATKGDHGPWVVFSGYLASRRAASTSAAAADAHRDLEARRTSGQIVLLV